MVRETRHLWVSNQPEIVREDRIRDHFKRSTEDVSPQSFEQRGSSYYDRNSRLVSETDQYIRRSNNIHPSEIRGSNNFHPSDLRGRTRERVYRNGPCSYPAITERSISGGHHRVSTWYDTGSSSISSISGQGSSPATRSVYGNVASAVVQPDTSTLYDCPLLKSKNKKSRSGSESPCGGSSSVNATSSHSSSHIVDRGNGGSAASSRSHSRSPSSCSSTNSTSSNSHASSPVSGSDPPLSSTSSTTSRSRNLQSAVSAPNQSGNLVVHSEDNRPLAICVRNLPARSSDTSLKDGLFHEYKKHGKVTWVKVVGQNAERYALVCFKKPEDVEKALEVSQDKLFFGCKIEVEPYQGYDVEDNEFRPYEAELDEYHPKSTRTLFIGNLEKDITGSDIRNHFECFGEIIEIDIKKQGMNAYAFCQYSDIVSVVKAMRKMDGEHLGNNRIKLGFGKSMPTNCVWIDGITDSVSENYLTQQFKSYGPITEVVIDRDRKLALVSFEQVQCAQLAVKEMRGASLRGRKLQVDFASRECREKFCSKVEKQTAGSRFNSRYGCSGNSSGAIGVTGNADTPSTSQSRSRASSFSRHSNLNSTSAAGVGGTSPAPSVSSACGASIGGCAGIVPASSGVIGAAGAVSATTGSVGAGSSTPRGSRASRIIRHSDYDYSEQRLRSYDEFSQGSAASHDDESYNYASNCLRSDSPQSRVGANALDSLEVSSTSSGRRRCDKSPGIGDIRNLQKERFQILEQLEECPSSGDELVSPKKRMKFDHSAHHHNHHHTVSSLTQSVPASTQLSSSSTSSSAPSGLHLPNAATGTHDCNTTNNPSSNNTSSSSQPTNPLIGDSNCDVHSNHSNVTSCSLHHRKCVEVRRLSECSLNLKYGSQLSSSSVSATAASTPSSSRRPSTDISGVAGSGPTPTCLFSTSVGVSASSGPNPRQSGSVSSQDSANIGYAAPHSLPCKRRRTTASCIVGGSSAALSNNTSNDTSEHHSSRGRGHQLHSHHSHEASGGESADGSRPGTPLCDERPEVSLSEPRRIPRDKPHEPMTLPLPKFGIQFFQQHRLTIGSGGSGGSMGGQSTSSSGATSSLLHTGQLYSSSVNSSSSTNISNINSSSGIINNTSSSSSLLNSNNNNNNNNSHSSLSNTLSSPPPLMAGSSRLSATLHHHHHHHSSNNSSGSSSSSSSLSHHHHHQNQLTHHHHHHQQHHTNFVHGVGSSHASGEQAPSSPLRPRSLSSNSSDSDAAPASNSPSIEERLKTLDEMYELWSGGGSGSISRPHTLSSDHLANAAQSRHKFLELDVNEVKPSEFAKRVLAKKSIFDDDLQRLKNISDKYEPGDFSNIARNALVSTSPGIPNLAATKTPVVGGNPAAKQSAAQSMSVFHSPSVNSLQRLNSPMNSPQAMSPYNSPSPSPVVAATMAKTASSQQAVVPPQPAKGLQYPFPSHPPVVMTPTTPPTTPVLSTTQPKPKISATTKSFSLQEKPVSLPPTPNATASGGAAGIGSSTTNPNRVLCKSASVPGSTNIGTVKTPLSVISPNAQTTAGTAKSDDTTDSPAAANSSRRNSADPSSGKTLHAKSSAAKKADKIHKQNHRNDSDTKKSKSEKSRSESIDKRKASFSSEDKEELADSYEKDSAVANERLLGDEERSKKSDTIAKEANAPVSSGKRSEKERSDRKLEKRREKEEREREERDKKAAAEQEHREMEEKERREKEGKERERREKEEREREEHARKEKAEREERERKEREDRERKEREEQERKEREERERKEREERERREKEREECMRREREERERREREEIAKREKEEKERKEREDALRREREEREEAQRREKEERERREKEERERREKEAEDRDRGEKEEQPQIVRDEREKKSRDKHEMKDFDDHAFEKRERRDREEVSDRKDRRDREDKRSELRNHEQHKELNAKDRSDFVDPKMNDDDMRTKSDEYSQQYRHLHHHREDKHHHKDNNNDSMSTLIEDQQFCVGHSKRRKSASSPIRMAKRRLSSQDSIETEENAKRIKTNAENRKALDRLDSKESNRSTSKHHKSHGRANSLTKNPDDKLIANDERCRKDSGFEEKKSKDKDHKKYDKTLHKHKKSSSTSVEKEDHEMRSPTEKSHMFEMHEIRSSDDDHQLQQQHQRHRNKKEHKEKKRHDHDEEPPRRSSDSKRHDNSRHDRKLSTKSDETSHRSTSDKMRSKPPSRKMTQSSNDSDSDEPKKHSIFDILDDGPYVSMYDKVKARSCKNMQKQEEEKKIKAKFSQLKQCRAKREEKKRSTSYDGDSDSDFDDRQTKYKRSSFINSSSEDENSAMNRIKDQPMSDSDSDLRRVQYNRARLNELCDGDSSEGGSMVGATVPCKKISSKRNSRSTRIVSDSSDTESSNRVKAESLEKNAHQKNISVKHEIKTEDETEISPKMNRFNAIKPENMELPEQPNYDLKLEIKEEPNDDMYSSHISESEANVCSGSAVECKDSVLDQMFAADVRKKHKKSKKRQKTASHTSEADGDKCVDVKTEKHSPTSLEQVFDELKRESLTTSNSTSVASSLSHFPDKKKHKDRKEKKREKSREEYEKLSKEERHRLRKSKKSKGSTERYVSEASKRSGEKMEDIFGPISDEETQLSISDTAQKDQPILLYETVTTGHNLQPVVSAALNPYKQEPLTPKSHSVEENEENKQKSSSHADRERHRKEKREKKRKEREKNREQHALAAFQQQKHEDENSVDLDEAGRALEAQLMEDSDNKMTEETTPSTATTHKSEMQDVFRFSDGDENSMEVASQEKREHADTHKSKEKKKKKKRSKEERHQKREHHHHGSTHTSNQSAQLPSLASNKLSIEITAPADLTEAKPEELCKPSPSLPCLLSESPPRKNSSRSDLELSISPLSRDQPNMISPIPKTPTTSSPAIKPVECKKKPDKFIPGFDVELDEKISESAVKSISTEFTSLKEETVVDDTKITIDSTVDPKVDKNDEKSRVVISQEETEDAVAALLGESFGSNTVDYSFTDDPCEIQPEEDVSLQDTGESCPVIPEEEAEEMRKAVQSLSTEDIEIKPDTPQSEQDLQIDTDTEEQDDDVPKVEESPSKSQQGLAENNKQTSKSVAVSKPNESEKKSATPVKAMAKTTANAIDVRPEKPVEVSKMNEVKPLTKAGAAENSDIPTEKLERSSPISGLNAAPQRSNSSSSLHQTTPASPSMPVIHKSSTVMPRSQAQFVMQPPTISIPESAAFVYPPINIMLSPRGNGNDHRMQSPRHTQQAVPSKGQPSAASQFVNVRVSSPQSPNIRPNQAPGIRNAAQLSPVVPPHMVMQPRQLMSPPHVLTGGQAQAGSPGNVTLNRIPVTTVLAPISKPLQQSSIILPQPNTAHSSINPRQEVSTDNKDNKAILSQPVVYQSSRVATPTPSSTGSPLHNAGQPQSTNIQMASQSSIKTVIEAHSATQLQQVVPIQLAQGKMQPHQTVVLQTSPQTTSKQPHLHSVQSGRPSQQQSPSQQMQQQMVKFAQQQQLFQQHQMMQHRQQQIQMQQHQHAQILQMQHKQQQQHQHQQKQSSNQQQGAQVLAPHRIVHQQTIQVHPCGKGPPTPLPQTLSKDVTHKITVPVQAQLSQGIAGKDLQPPRIQQNVVVVRQQASVLSQQSPVISKQCPQQSVTPSPSQSQPQIHQQQSTPVILQQRQPGLPQVSSPLIFQHKVTPQSHQTAVQGISHQPTVKVQIPVAQPQDSGSPAPAPQSAIPSAIASAKLPPGEDQHATKVEGAPKPVSESKKAEPSEQVDLPVTPKERETEVTHAEKLVEAKKEVGKAEVKAMSPQQKELENVSVIKSQTAATPVQPAQSAVLSEDNVSKFSVPIDDNLEHDSKEEWSAKELNIESVIKKVDALCSTDEDIKSSKKHDKSSAGGKESIQKEAPEPSTELKEMAPDKLPDISANLPSIDLEKKSEHADTVNSVDPDKSDDTHDEEEYDESVDSNKPMRGGKRGGRSNRGGKKAAAALQSGVSSQISTAGLEGVQTRRGKTAQGGRGRKGRGGQSRSPATASPAAALSEKKSRNQLSDQDVYEFHEDSGEENVSTKSERPRLILTIKSPGQATPQVIQAKPANAPAAPSQPPQPVVAVAPLSAPTLPQPQPATTQSMPEATTPPQKDQREREEFTTPATNTRKSRRLLEKDGGTPGVRNTVDDTIEDVVRNISSPKVQAGGQTPPRRSTRNTVQTTSSRPAAAPQQVSLEKPVSATDIRKSPRANRRSKDRKISETSVDSSDERTSMFDEKTAPKQHVHQALGNQTLPSSPMQQQQVNVTDAEPKAISEKKTGVESTSEQKELPLNIPRNASPIGKATETSGTKQQDPTETLALIDPVTGLLTVFQQSKEGKYVPVPGAPSAAPNAKLVGKQLTQVVISREDGKLEEGADGKLADVKRVESQPNAIVDSHKVANVLVKGTQPQTTGTPPISSGGVAQVTGRAQGSIAPISIQQQQMQRVQVHVQSPVPTSQSHDALNVQVSQGHQQPQFTLHKVPDPGQVQPAQVQVQQQPSMMPTQLPVQQQPAHQSQAAMQQQTQLQSQAIRTHPLKAHMLNSQHNTALNKSMVGQNIVKVAAGVVSQATAVVTSSNLTKAQQSSIVQSNIVTRHVTQGGVPQQSQQSINLGQMSQQPSSQSIHNLYVNIPPSSSAVQVAVAHSPRIQQGVVAKTEQGPPSSQQPVQLLHVVTKPIAGNQQQQIIAQHQPVVIHSNKMPQTQAQYATVLQGGKIIQQGAPIQTSVGGKPQTIQVSMPHMPQQQQQGPSQAQVQQQHVQQLHVQKQSPTISVVTHQLGKQVQIPGQPQQQPHHQQQHSNTPPHMVQTVQQVSAQLHVAPQAGGIGNAGKPSGVPPNSIHMVAGQQPGIILGSQHIVSHAAHQSSLGLQPSTGATILQAKPAHQQQMAAANKGVIGLHQSSQIMTGAVPSPPLKQPHMSGQQPVVTGASSLRTSVPPISPQGQARSHMLQPGLPAPAFDANLHDIGGFGAQLSQSPPPAHQQASPITPGEGTFAGGAIRGMPRDHYIMYQQYYRAQPEARIPYIPRSPLVQGSGAEQKDMSEVDDAMVASPPLELRRPGSGSRTIAVPHGLQSPQDRATDSPQVAQVYVHTRIPHPQYQEVSGRYFEPVRQVTAEPPPAHRSAHSVVTPSPSRYAPEPQPSGPPANLAHIHPKMIGREREREQREREQREREQRDNEARYYVDDKRDRVQRKRENERTSIPPGHTGMPSHESLVPAMPTPTGRSIQVATPPHASQVPPQGDSLLTLLQRYPVMWQGLLALKTDQAAVQMHFVFGNPMVARGSLPCNSDGSTPPLRIAQRMRLEQTQLDGVAKKMQYENEHCMLLALPCGRNHMDVLQQSRNLQTGFITYLQQKMAAGIVNIPVPGSDQAAYVVHIFPSCDFANENLERAAPDLKHRVAEIAHLLIIIATV